MKLYTEADLKKVISIYSEEYKNSTDEILKELNLTPVELPSDEDIWEAGNNEGLNSKQYSFVRGAKWMLYEIKGGKK